MVLGILCVILCGVIFGLGLKIYFLKKSARQITEELAQKLKDDTNTVIGIASRDRDMCALAQSLNSQLKLLRKAHHRYVLGDRELKTAVTNMSHDLRTPLTAISGYLDLIKKEENSPRLKNYLAIVEERTEEMKNLTDELFRYSVILSGEEEMEAGELCINQVLEDCIMGYFAAFNEKGIVVKADLTEKKIIRKLDRKSLERVFSNLISNALKYSDNDLDITLLKSGEIVFSNSARGLTGVDVEQLFDRFYTVENARNSTGLGLSIARELVKRMQGRITAEYRDNVLSIHIIFP